MMHLIRNFCLRRKLRKMDRQIAYHEMSMRDLSEPDIGDPSRPDILTRQYLYNVHACKQYDLRDRRKALERQLSGGRI